MSTTTRMQIRSRFIETLQPKKVEKGLKIAFLIYGICSLLSMAAMSVGAALLFVMILLSTSSFQEWKHEVKKPFSRRVLTWSLLLFFCVLISLISAIFFPLEYSHQHSEVHFFKDLTKCWYFFWPLILVVGLRRLTERSQDQVLNTWIGAFAILSVIGILQYFTAWPRGQGIPGEPTHYHTTLFLGHHLSVASILIFPFFIALDRAWLFRKTPKKKLFYGLAAALGAGALYFTYSRTLWMALPIGILVWVIWRLPKKWAIATVLVAVLGVIGATQYPPIAQRIHTSMGIGDRRTLWAANWEFFLSRPLTGVGWRHNHELSGFYLMEKMNTKDVFAGHAHNNFLDVLGGMGLFGAISWLGWCLVTLWAGARKRVSGITSGLNAGWVCAWLVFHLNGLTQVNFWEAKVQHQIAWIVAWTLL
ncbi:MAG: O-antigen ligase family protein [Bdellovibrio sp.]|nr:O-antigen ligase family protein [Bdellovibrio sp.]